MSNPTQGRKGFRPWAAGMLLLLALLSLLHGSAHGRQDGRPRQMTHPDAPASPQRRIALVVGNGNYRNAPRLGNPVNDARDMASALRSLSFEVLEGEDQTADQMKRLILQFGERLSRAGGVGLFYYAGHGVQVGGRNYMIPVEATSLREETIEYDAVDVGRVLAEMEAANNGFNIVVLDACRSNPFSRGWRSSENGLAQIIAPEGTLIAYATSPGKVADDGQGRNGVYTAELLKQIKVPGQNVEAMFKAVRAGVKASTKSIQVPWEFSSLVGDFYFAGVPEIYGSNPRTGAENELKTLPSRGGQNRGAKSGKVIFFSAIQGGSGHTVQAIFSSIDEFLPQLFTDLKQKELNVTSSSASTAVDTDQVRGVVYEILNGRKSSTRSAPYAIAIYATFTVEDRGRSPYTGANMTVTKINFVAIDLEKGEIIANEDVTGAQGFGSDAAQSLRNSIKEALSRLSETFISKVSASAW